MSESKSNPQNLSEAIRRIESATKNGGGRGPLADDIDMIKKAVEDLKTAASSMLQEPINQAKDKAKEYGQKAQEYGKEVDKAVHENPWWAIGIAGLVAFLIGFLLGRKD